MQMHYKVIHATIQCTMNTGKWNKNTSMTTYTPNWKRYYWSVYSEVLHVFPPLWLFLDYCVLISISASSVGLMWRWIGPCESTGWERGWWWSRQEYVWRSVSDLETSQRKRCQRPLLCPGYSRSQRFSWQPADKRTPGVSTTCSLSPLTFHPLLLLSFFLLISHPPHNLSLSTLFKQTQKKRCWTRLPTQSPFIYVLLYSCRSNTLESAHGSLSLFERAVCSLSFYLNEWAGLQPVRLWFG